MQMDAATFFGRISKLVKDNPPHPNDQPILDRMRRVGLDPNEQLDVARMPPEARRRLEQAVIAGQRRLLDDAKRAGTLVNGWQMLSAPIGTYGTAYVRRAAVASLGLGANVPDDAVYPMATNDARGEPLDATRSYVIRFARDQLPPVRAFWSVTLYDDRQLFAENPIHRYALGDRDKLVIDADGSIAIRVQRESPGPAEESNWLPTPASGRFSLNLRLYWPKLQALDGTWAPPPIEPR
jgi:hypothetical protein